MTTEDLWLQFFKENCTRCFQVVLSRTFHLFIFMSFLSSFSRAFVGRQNGENPDRLSLDGYAGYKSPLSASEQEEDKEGDGTCTGCICI